MTDNSSYSAFCHKTAKNPKAFDNFKSIPTYFGIVENVSRVFGREFLDMIMEQSPEILQHLEAFKQNDHYDNPKTYTYPETGTISPTTLRYIKIASEIQKRFGNLDDCTIIEVG